MATSTTHHQSVLRYWRSVGVWMAALLAASQLLNAARAVLDPPQFATAFGLPLASQEDARLLGIYASRALFLGSFAFLLIFVRQVNILKWFILSALVMPAGDAALTLIAGAPVATVGRHSAYLVYILITALLLHRHTSRVD